MTQYHTIINPPSNWIWLIGLILLIVGSIGVAVTAYFTYKTKKLKFVFLAPLAIVTAGMTLLALPIATARTSPDHAAQTASKEIAKVNNWNLDKWDRNIIKSSKVDYAVTATYKEAYCKLQIKETKSYKPWQPGATYDVTAYCLPDLGTDFQKYLDKIKKLPQMKIYPN